MITSYGYGTLRLKEGPNQPGPIFSTLFIYFIQFFSLISYSLRDPITYAPNFLFSRPHFTTPLTTHIHDSHSRLHLRLTFATHVRNSTSDSHSRLMFATPLATHIRDSRSRPQSRLAVSATSLSCNSTTDRRTVSTPQRHLPSVPTLTLIKEFGTFSLAWPPPIATAHHHVHHP